MPKRAWAYIWFIYITGGMILASSLLNIDFSRQNWLLFIILLALSTVTQLMRVEAPTHQLYHPAYSFIMSGALLLDPFLFNAMVIISHLAEWYREHRLKSKHLQNWYIQPFNIAMHILLGAAVRVIFAQINPIPGNYVSPLAIIGAMVSALVYVLMNHLIVGLVISLARKVSFKESGVWDFDGLAIDFSMLTMGFMFTVLMASNLWLLIPALSPLYLIYRALTVPQLKQKANIDPKTGLWNAEYFYTALEVEINRASRYNRPLTVVMADIDLLRNINNTYGHIAGDAVLIGVAQIFKTSFREYDLISRFGGEEFAFLIPETTAKATRERVESLRKKIEEAEFQSPVTQQRILVTMSFGIAELNGAQQSAKELLHWADVAVYAAKLNGRNQTCVYSDELMNVLNH